MHFYCSHKIYLQNQKSKKNICSSKTGLDFKTILVGNFRVLKLCKTVFKEY